MKEHDAAVTQSAAARGPRRPRTEKKHLRIPVRTSAKHYYIVEPQPEKNRPDYYVRFDVPRDIRLRRPDYPHTIFRSTGLIALKPALFKARDIIEEVLAERLAAADRVKLKGPAKIATLGDILEHYDSPEIDPETRRRNKSTARMFAREVAGREDVDSLALHAVINGQAAKKFKATRLKAVEGADYLRQLQVRKTVNATLAQVKSLFSKEAMESYAGLELPHDAIAEFKAVPRAKVKDEDLGFEPWPQGFSERLDAEAQALRHTNRNLYLVYLLMSRLGLRNKEVEYAKWDALEQAGERTQFVVRVRSYSRSKNGRARALLLSNELLEKLLPFRDGPEQWIIDTPTKTDRHNVTHREINQWLRPKMVAAGMVRAENGKGKCAYQLRGHAGSRVLTLTGSIAAAAAFLGDNEETVRKHYARWLKPIEALSTSDFVQTFRVLAA